MVKAIIFDLRDTIGTKGFPISKEFRMHFGIPESATYLKDYEESIQLQVWETKDDLAKAFLQRFHIPVTRENVSYIVGVYDKGIMQAKPYVGMTELLAELHKKYKLGCISNTTNFEIGFLDRFHLRSLFDAVVSSHDIAALKPSKKIFDEVVRMLGVACEDCLFIDDSALNVAKARTLGMHVIRFESVHTLKDELEKRAVL